MLEAERDFRLTQAEMGRSWIDERHVVPNDLESIAAGPFLAAILASIDRSRLNGHDAVRVLEADARMEAYFAALKYESMAEVAFSPHPARRLMWLGGRRPLDSHLRRLARC